MFMANSSVIIPQYNTSPDSAKTFGDVLINLISSKIILALTIITVLTCHGLAPVAAQVAPEYECNYPKEGVFYSKLKNAYSFSCSLRTSVNEEQLRDIAEQVYRGLDKHSYEKLIITWASLQPYKYSDDGTINATFGTTRFENGQLTEIKFPEYECFYPEKGVFYSKLKKAHIFSCYVRTSVNEEKLRDIAEQVYRELDEHSYEKLVITWVWALPSNDGILRAAFGTTRFESGQLTKIECPQTGGH